MTASTTRLVLPPRARSTDVMTATLKSEWTKLRTVRSTIWSLLATVGITIGLGTLFCAAIVSRWDHLDAIERLRFDGTARSLSGIFLAQLAIGVLGVLIVGSEYTTGMIRTTFAATPRRRTVIAAKAMVLGSVACIVGLVASFIAFGIGQSILKSKHVGASLSDPGVVRAICGAGIYLMAVALLGFGIATVVRRTPGAIAVLFGIVLVLPLLARALPSPWDNDVSKLLPASAGESLFSVRSAPDILTPGRAALVLAVWVTVVLAGAFIATARRDA